MHISYFYQSTVIHIHIISASNQNILPTDMILQQSQKKAHQKIMSSNKLAIVAKYLTNIKIPWNISQQELQYTIVGSILFGIAACLYFFVFGKLIGRISLVQLIKVSNTFQHLSVYFTVLAGVIFCSAFVKELNHEHYVDLYPYDTKTFIKNSDEAVLAIAGLLVGIGSGLAGGCTFGHGISGLARRQKASFLAVVIFCTIAHLTTRYNLASRIPEAWSQKIRINLPTNLSADYYIHGALIVPFLFFVAFKDKSVKGLVKYMLNFGIGVLFGIGMITAGITKRENVLEALNFNARFWNPSMAIFYGTAILFTSILLTIIIRRKITPVFAETLENPQEKVTLGLVFGSACFGVGWGLGGLCPGTMYALIPGTNIKVPFYWAIACIIGFKIAEILQKLSRKFKGHDHSQKA